MPHQGNLHDNHHHHHHQPHHRSKTEMSKNLEKERAGTSFPVRTLTHFLNDGEANTLLKERIAKIVAAEPALRNSDIPFLSRQQRYERAMEQLKRVQEIRRQQQLNAAEYAVLREMTSDSYPQVLIHDTIFLPNLAGQCSKEQYDKWYKLSEEYGMIGCYIQTELGHGSNVRGLETTATYLPETDEFDIHSPTPSSTKWWVGALGKTATHGVVYARLIIGGVDRGVHAFMVQLRSLETHQVLPGRQVGDIGPKFGFNSMDNGWARFHHVRIPRADMLMKFATVSREGVYKKPPSDRLVYLTMVSVRAGIVASSCIALAKATTIAIRYSVVREQFGGDSGGPETKVLDYVTQQQRLFPWLACAYALHFTGRHMTRVYHELTASLNSLDLSVLPELHATSSALKSMTTWLAAEGIEECRRCCGGHGYSQSSGLPDLYGTYVHITTAEGDNTVLMLQTARFLLKCLGQVKQGKSLSGQASYLADTAAPAVDLTDGNIEDPALLLSLFRSHARWWVQETGLAVEREVRKGVSATEALNQAGPMAVRAGKAHALYVVLSCFADGLKEVPHPSIRTVLNKLFCLFALSFLDKASGDFLEASLITTPSPSVVRAAMGRLLATIRPDAVGLVDAFGLSDHYLQSAIGRADGKAYEALLQWVENEPLNKQSTPPGHMHIAPLLRLSRM